MNARLLDFQDPLSVFHGTAISSSADLTAAIDSLRRREPSLVELEGDNGLSLKIGVAADVGCVQFSRSDGSPPYLMAVSPFEADATGERDFYCGDTPTPVSERHCMPLQLVLEIADVFLSRGEQSTAVGWEEI